MKSIVFGLSVVMALAAGSKSFAQCAPLALPMKFDVDQNLTKVDPLNPAEGKSFSVSGGGSEVGNIIERSFSLRRAFTFEDSHGNRLASAHQKLTSVGTNIEVLDCENKKIGSIKVQLLKTALLKTVSGGLSAYSILDANGKVIGTSEKIEGMFTDFILRDSRGRVAAKLEKLRGVGIDLWEVEIIHPDSIDSRILMMMAAFKSASDIDN